MEKTIEYYFCEINISKIIFILNVAKIYCPEEIQTGLLDEMLQPLTTIGDL